MMSLKPEWAIKNIEYWWKNHHYNPDGKVTAWHPKMKPIIFTEIGFPSIDGCTNQPNLYIDLTSNTTTIPPKSKGKPDYKAQQLALEATLDYWKEKELQPGNTGLVGDKGVYVYGIDARYDFHKHPEIYADVQNYQYGHWIKLDSINNPATNFYFYAVPIVIILLAYIVAAIFKTK